VIRVPGWLIYLVFLLPLWIIASGRWHVVQFAWGVLIGLLTLPIAWRIFELGRWWPLGPLLWGLLGIVRSFFVLFIPDAVRSSIDMANRIIRPVVPMAPGIIAIPVRFRGPVDAFLLVSHITLTPGQIVVDIDEERGLLFLHAIDARDPDAIRRHVQETHRQELRRLYR
jgi:multicomponent Na+:H+ antiporter subunit E